jgi:hypothetical protein
MQKLLGASWKTTLAGISTILVGIGNAVAEFSQGGFGAINWTVLFAAITTGVGLIAAKDAGVSNAPSPVPAQQVSK